MTSNISARTPDPDHLCGASLDFILRTDHLPPSHPSHPKCLTPIYSTTLSRATFILLLSIGISLDGRVLSDIHCTSLNIVLIALLQTDDSLTGRPLLNHSLNLIILTLARFLFLAFKEVRGKRSKADIGHKDTVELQEHRNTHSSTHAAHRALVSAQQ